MRPLIKDKLFRQEVIDAKREKWLGEILLVRPLGITFFTTFASLIVVAIGLVLWKGEYTRKEKVTGRLVSSQGIVKIYAPVAGTVVKKLVREGDTVSKGQILYIVSTELNTVNGGVQDAIAEKIASKKRMLSIELEAQRRVLKEEESALSQKVLDVSAQLQSVEREITTQTRRAQLSEENLVRYRDLSTSKFISSAQLSEREQDKLDQDARLQSLRRTQMSLGADLASVKSALKNAPLSAANKLSAIERGISDTEQQGYENDARREIAITALQDGLATALSAETGQTVTPTIPMLSILPTNSEFEAYLYVPSRAIGFMHEGARALIRYQAFPYQKFGQYGATIKTISRSALPPGELRILNMAPEEFYRVIVSLDEQHVMAYGKKTNLQDGMALDADVLLDTRKLYEWLLEPLYSITGKL
ncbi:membrane fusion protein [Duganella sp. 1411]|jgi:membrane fusion protein|uniref:HlyD family secretion protein n=1 Tax=Duganella sp. 1411 TaxID=2806572 RepID=UPI001AE26278|nr:HlyD family efflux transporter periplasmic adaptor subunit [Duganella sp. 1411]MBP1205693.1 membrane fusion protein [Duganella sp. 1411]